MKHYRTKIEGLSYKSSLNYALSEAINLFKKGIGLSKRSIKMKYGYSPLIHSYETLERYIGIINNFRDTVLKDER